MGQPIDINEFLDYSNPNDLRILNFDRFLKVLFFTCAYLFLIFFLVFD